MAEFWSVYQRLWNLFGVQRLLQVLDDQFGVGAAPFQVLIFSERRRQPSSDTTQKRSNHNNKNNTWNTRKIVHLLQTNPTQPNLTKPNQTLPYLTKPYLTKPNQI